MKTFDTKRPLAIILGGMIGAMGLASVAHADHNSKISCYAYVHDQCYGGGETNCSSEDYNWGLDQCDGYYPSIRPTVRPIVSNLALPKTNNMTLRSTIKRTMR